ncbi:MAG: hypothetical protein JWP89_765 [Schlesneria sp.]|nr:hypothetical protein [Schlesneria sp.]
MKLPEPIPATPSHGRIKRIVRPEGPSHPQQGYGIISTFDGRDVIFEESGLVNVEFSQLEVDREVAFVEVPGMARARSVWSTQLIPECAP